MISDHQTHRQIWIDWLIDSHIYLPVMTTARPLRSAKSKPSLTLPLC
jgi:hypothetical protein